MILPGDTFPYIGLRPFTEEDSLYFKGRDEQILQLTALLEANRFLMVTGASGDGKSSLVYAGLLPNARAGFFKARYANWVVADFRPERMPLHNLSKTLSKNLRIGNEASVEIELRRGFSSLVELYTTSSLYVDEGGEAWKLANTNERDEMHRGAANLLIVTDQFEEFFTNPENYYRNSPSADSQLVINLLLETVRISIERDLPVYIVCTMRSDYIGKCAAFRGLPEFIGFSQFFVPRLKRKEMVQVVREPAFLHGDKITDRLVERVVYDLGEGIDQLPVLEHAMNEVWIQAGHGKEELDLIHYAMAGGMAAQELPQDDRKRFEEWFKSLPANYQEAYLHPGLSQIIDTHANKLYLSAADFFNQRHKKQISPADAQLIIKIAFTCLTKMDEGKAVRNRMTLQEITDILSKPELTTEVVGGVLNIFREPGNTFLRPYISDDPESHELRPDTVLDITHESLIRNWDLLTQWAKEEYEHLVVYEDFKKQLDRWLGSHKSGGFLLSIGPLTYFESWHEKLHPSPYWINRYLDPGRPLDDRLKESNQVIADSKEFLKKSAAQHRITRLVVRHGAAKLAAIAAALIIGVLGIYFYLDARKKENANVLQRVFAEGESLIRNPQVIPAHKAVFVVISENLRPGSFKRIVDAIPASQRLSVLKEIYTEFAWNSNSTRLPLRFESLQYTDSLLQTSTDGAGNNDDKEGRLRALDVLMNEGSHYAYFFQDPAGKELLNRTTGQLKTLIMDLMVANPDGKLPDVRRIDDGIEHLLNNKALSESDIHRLLEHYSPFESETARKRFNKNFPEGSRVNYARGNFFNHSGGYQIMAYLYAALGDIRRVNACVDSLSKALPNYKNFADGSLQIAYLLTYNHLPELIDHWKLWCATNSPRRIPLRAMAEQHRHLYSMDFSNKLWDR